MREIIFTELLNFQFNISCIDIAFTKKSQPITNEGETNIFNISSYSHNHKNTLRAYVTHIRRRYSL